MSRGRDMKVFDPISVQVCVSPSPYPHLHISVQPKTGFQWPLNQLPVIGLSLFNIFFSIYIHVYIIYYFWYSYECEIMLIRNWISYFREYRMQRALVTLLIRRKEQMVDWPACLKMESGTSLFQLNDDIFNNWNNHSN